jgi:hypothetical protein
MARVLILAATTGYQTRAFGEAAERLGVDLVFATDRCNVLDDPWFDAAIPIRFQHPEAATATILDAVHRRPVQGVLAVGDRPTVIAAQVLERLGLPGHPPEAAAAASDKLRTRERLRAAGMAVPAFEHVPLATDVRALAADVSFPVVIKPLALSGSRGVMRADNRAELVAAFYRLRALLQAPDVRAERGGDSVLVEGFIEGREFAVEALMTNGGLQILAIFDKPDPLNGPFFEETIYLTPSSSALPVQRALGDAVFSAARALGLRHGPIHAECRVNDGGVFVLEVAARPIGGLCARSLRFCRGDGSRFRGDLGNVDTSPRGGGACENDSRPLLSFEELLLRHAIGEPAHHFQREPDASGVMMIPIPRRGVLRHVDGIDRARAVADVVDVRITAKPDQLLTPLPEGASYLGFIFARAPQSVDVDRALRKAHAELAFTIDPEVRVLQSTHG